jgi:hypothetical protein
MTAKQPMFIRPYSALIRVALDVSTLAKCIYTRSALKTDPISNAPEGNTIGEPAASR